MAFTLRELSYLQLAAAIAALCVLWLAGTILYRIYVHPLAGVPGPFWAKITSFYGFYFNMVRGGTYYREVERLHGKHGASKRPRLPRPLTQWTTHL